MRIGYVGLLAIGAALSSCKHDPSPKDLCDHIAEVASSGSKPSAAQSQRCATELAAAKTAKPEYYACYAACVAKAKAEDEVDDCKFACGAKETPVSVCRRLLALRNDPQGGSFSSCVSRYQVMQDSHEEQFDCASGCARKATSRAEAESCLSGCAH